MTCPGNRVKGSVEPKVLEKHWPVVKLKSKLVVAMQQNCPPGSLLIASTETELYGFTCKTELLGAVHSSAAAAHTIFAK